MLILMSAIAAIENPALARGVSITSLSCIPAQQGPPGWGPRGPCGHQQPFGRWCGGERWLGGHISLGGREETPPQWGSASGDVPWSCARCLRCGRASAHHGGQFPEATLVPSAHLEFATEGDARQASTDQR